MCINLDKLKGKMAEHRITQEALAEQIGIDPSTLYRKMKSDGANFTVGQMHKIVDVLHLSPDEAKNIFLWQNSHYCEKEEQEVHNERNSDFQQP